MIISTLFCLLSILVGASSTEEFEEYKLILRLNAINVNGPFDKVNFIDGNINTDDPTMDHYGIIGLISQEKNKWNVNGGKYKFYLIYNNADGSTSQLIWRQSSWLQESTITGFEGITINPPEDASLASHQKFQGLGLSNYPDWTYLDGNGGGYDWWNSVGTVQKYDNGIAAFNTKIAYSTHLYIVRPRELCLANGFNAYKILNGQYKAVAHDNYMPGGLDPALCTGFDCYIYKFTSCNGVDYYIGYSYRNTYKRLVITTTPPPPAGLSNRDHYVENMDDILIYGAGTYSWGSRTGWSAPTIGPCV